MKKIKFAVPLLLSALLAACSVGPNYVRPDVDTPKAFKETAGWKAAQPGDLQAQGKWWEAFNDKLLNQYEEQVVLANQNLAQVEGRVRQARALLQGSRAAQFPSLSGVVQDTRSSAKGSTAPATSHVLSLDANWEVDIWGKVRRNVEAGVANAQASDADLMAARLSTQAQLAQTYFQLRGVDAQQALYQQTLADYQRSLLLAQNQYKAGVVPRENVVAAQTQLKSTEAQGLDLGVTRSQLEHVIALLLGRNASDFSVPPEPLHAVPPVIPVTLPSTLLERRPDIAAAERRMAAANAQIGVAMAAYFPDLSISAAGGFQSSTLANWLSLPNRFWSVGPALAQTIFDGGARRAQTAQAEAGYDISVAAYRQTVLTGFQEVEDNLAALRILEQEAEVQGEAVAAARESVVLSTNQYKAGVVSYLNVINAQTAALSNQRAAIDILNRRLTASILLIKALGGGWQAAGLTP
jgi:NodT family efflux transporter outer membrane factor (OMF) lipoprotein